MDLIFQTHQHMTRVSWSHYALLRDNVQHYLESGPGQPTYSALHAIERAVDGEVERVRALELRRELQRAWRALADIRLAESAVSLRTRAILSGFTPPPVRGTFPARLSGWPLPVAGDERDSLRQHLECFVEGLLALTDHASVTDELTVSHAA